MFKIYGKGIKRNILFTLIIFELILGLNYLTGIVKIQIENGNFIIISETTSGIKSEIPDEQLRDDFSRFNNESTFNRQVLIFNRVPKTGSEMFSRLLTKLSKINNFTNYGYVPGVSITRQLEPNKQVKVINGLMKLQQPFSLNQHVFFLNFTELGYKPPLYINMIRDPVEKIISRFYYWRQPSSTMYKKIKDPQMPKEEWMSMTYEKCVEIDYEECRFETGMEKELTIPYFCGHDPRCQILNDNWALNRAIENVDNYYAVVGILENLEETFLILQNSIPEFFNNVLRTYLSSEKRSINVTPNKRSVRTDVKAKLAANLTNEYIFYNYIKNRLLLQYNYLNLGNSNS